MQTPYPLSVRLSACCGHIVDAPTLLYVMACCKLVLYCCALVNPLDTFSPECYSFLQAGCYSAAAAVPYQIKADHERNSSPHTHILTCTWFGRLELLFLAFRIGRPGWDAFVENCTGSFGSLARSDVSGNSTTTPLYIPMNRGQRHLLLYMPCVFPSFCQRVYYRRRSSTN